MVTVEKCIVDVLQARSLGMTRTHTPVTPPPDLTVVERKRIANAWTLTPSDAEKRLSETKKDLRDAEKDLRDAEKDLRDAEKQGQWFSVDAFLAANRPNFPLTCPARQDRKRIGRKGFDRAIRSHATALLAKEGCPSTKQ